MNISMLKGITSGPEPSGTPWAAGFLRTVSSVVLDEVSISPEEIRGLEKIFVTACGTAYHAPAWWVNTLLKGWVRLPVEVDIASGVPLPPGPSRAGHPGGGHQQSGETADT